MKTIHDFTNRIICGDCIAVMQEMPSDSVDLVVTDPPYIVRYRSRDGRRYVNDDNDAWLEPAFAEVYRVLKPDTYCVSFYGWHTADRFLQAWRAAGFRTLEQLAWVKDYPSSVGTVQRFHEGAYLLAKGRPPRPQILLRSILEWKYSGDDPP